MKQQKKSGELTIGLDLGDRRHRFCVLDAPHSPLRVYTYVLFGLLVDFRSFFHLFSATRCLDEQR
jgi:hypothetical protein